MGFQVQFDANSARDWLRSQMRVTNRYAYFDHAAVGPLPSASAKKIAAYAATAQEHGDALWLDWASGLGTLRTQLAELVGAEKSEIALVGSTTQGLNIVANGFPWAAGDNVVVPSNEFPSNSLPWKSLQGRGVECRQIPVGSDGQISVDQIASQIDSRTRILAISWVGFLSGFRIDVAKMVEMAHSKGCLVCLDAIQGLGAFPLNVQDTDVDFVCADGHKWMLGPEGAGLLYVAHRHLDCMAPVGIGWGSLAAGSFQPGAETLKTDASVFEGGSANMPGLLGLQGSIETLLEAGSSAPNSSVAVAILENVAQLADLACGAGLTVHLPAKPENRSGILSLSWPDNDTSTEAEARYIAARKFLLGRDIVLSVRGGRLRVSAHAYNNESDAQRLIDALIEFRSSNPEVS